MSKGFCNIKRLEQPLEQARVTRENSLLRDANTGDNKDDSRAASSGTRDMTLDPANRIATHRKTPRQPVLAPGI